jgi:type IV fimbrial biogenesis protein FimT
LQPLPSRRTGAGFTLIEIAVVLAILAVLLAIALPSFADARLRRRVHAASEQLLRELHWVRMEAAARGYTLRLSVKDGPGGSCLITHSGPQSKCQCASGGALCAGDAVLLRSHWLPAHDEVRFAANVSSMTFDPVHGTAIGGTVQVLAGNYALEHAVSSFGRVERCAASPSAFAGMARCK